MDKRITSNSNPTPLALFPLKAKCTRTIFLPFNYLMIEPFNANLFYGFIKYQRIGGALKASKLYH